MLTFSNRVEYETHYRERCQGDTLHLLDTADYEHPRALWLLGQAAGSVLDVGCCTGDVCGVLARSGLVVAGIDPGVAHIEIARQRYPQVVFVRCFAEEYGGPVADTVLCGDVIEHVQDDSAFVACLLRLGRRVLITTPNGPWESPEHLRAYTQETAAALVRPHGGTVDLIADRDGRPRWLGLTVDRRKA